MTSLLFGISLSAVLSVTSLLVVLFRVSPLTSPEYAIPAFLVSLFFTLSTCGALVFYALWRLLPIHSWDLGTLLSIALRQGIFLGCAGIVIVLFHLLGVLTWWIAILIIATFVLVELGLNS